MNNLNMGAGVLAMGELRRQEIDAHNAAVDAEHAIREAHNERDAAIAEKDRLIFAAKSQIHGMRAWIEGYTLTENELVAALKAANQNHPLASHEAVNSLVEKNRVKAMYDLAVIKKTYPDGEIPEGAIVILGDGALGVVGGQPAYPEPSPSERRANQERADMMAAAGLDGFTILDPARVTQAITTMQEVVKKTAQRLEEDNNKGFFGKMKKADKAAAEADLECCKRYVVLLREALPKAEEYVSKKDRLG